MIFLHTADPHFGGIPAIGKLTPFGIREREYDLIRALESIKEIAKSEVVDVLFIAGDIFNSSNPDSTSRKGWSEFIISLIRHEVPSLKKVYIVVGNHDCPNNDIKADSLQVDHQYITKLSDRKVEIIIADDVTYDVYKDGDKEYCVILVPYKDDPEYIRSKVNDIYNYFADNEDISGFIIVGHIEIKEAELGANDTKLKCGFSYKDEIFSNKRLEYAALGHIHKPQKFLNPISLAPVVYSGSPVSKDFNEAADWRRVIIGHNNGNTSFDYKEVEIPDRDFITILNGEGLDDLSPGVVNGSIIKLKFKGTLDYLKSFNTSSIVNRLEAMGALQIKIDRIVVKEIKDNGDSEAFRDSTSIPLACKTYIEKFMPNGMNKDKVLEMATSRIKRGNK